MNVVFPPDFEERMKIQLGGEFQAFALAHESDPPISIRVNPNKSPLPNSNQVEWTSFGQYLDSRPVFTLDPKFHGGAYYVQEASSMFLEQVIKQCADLEQPLKVLDLCAAPGGKSTHLLSLISGDSLLVSNETIRSRATVLSENIQKWGCVNVVVTNNDPHDFQRLKGYFDIILADAPCSGEGLFRKDPDATSEWTEANAAMCSARQQRIIQDVWPALKQNGVLIYCTCTYNPHENSAAMDCLAGSGEIIPINYHSSASAVQFYPHKDKGEGFFITAIRKISEEHPVRIKSKPIFNFTTSKITERLNEWVLKPDDVDFILQEDLIIMLPKKFRADIEFMMKELHVITKGTAVAELRHDKLVPDHAFALSVRLNKNNFPIVEVDRSQALQYLRRDNLVLNDERKGFALITFEGLPLGWVNLLGNRVNNLYPSSWRVRMQDQAI